MPRSDLCAITSADLTTREGKLHCHVVERSESSRKWCFCRGVPSFVIPYYLLLTLSKGKYDEAYTHFSEALKVAPNDQLHILYSNRSATLASLGRNEEALEDAKRVVELNPGFMKVCITSYFCISLNEYVCKGYLRTAMAYLALGNFAQAEAACRKGLEKFPGNESFTAALADIEAARKATPVEEGAEMNVEKPASPAPAAPAVPEAAPPAPLATTPSPPPTSAPAPESKEGGCHVLLPQASPLFSFQTSGRPCSPMYGLKSPPTPT